MLELFMLLVPASLYALGLMKGNAGRMFLLAGLIMHALSIALRGAYLQRPPHAEKHDNISFMAFSTAIFYYAHSRKKSAEAFAMFSILLVCMLVFVSMGFSQINTITPLLNSPWFYLHTFLYFLSYGFLGVSACAGGVFLIKRDYEYEKLQYTLSLWGWTILTISLLFGGIWFYKAYGTYWLWTSRELWISLLWLYYALYLHARLMKNMRGAWASAIGVSGYAIALFAYFGVGTVIKSPPLQF